MIIPDLNLLVYAYNSSSTQHLEARDWWNSCLSGREPVGVAWLVALGFIRLWTSPRIFANPMTADLAVSHVESWIERRVVRMLDPGPDHAKIVFRMIRESGNGGNLTMDAHLAALAVEHRGTIHTADTDFARFSGLEFSNPLARVRKTKRRL